MMRELRGLLLELSIATVVLLGICLLASLNCTVKVIMPPAATVTDTLYIVPHQAEEYVQHLKDAAPSSHKIIGYRKIDATTIIVRHGVIGLDGGLEIHEQRHVYNPEWHIWEAK